MLLNVAIPRVDVIVDGGLVKAGTVIIATGSATSTLIVRPVYVENAAVNVSLDGLANDPAYAGKTIVTVLPDGDLVEKGGVAEMLRLAYAANSDQANRNLYTCTTGLVNAINQDCAPNAGFQHTATPDGHAARAAEIVDGDPVAQPAHAPGFDIDYFAGAHLQGLAGVSGAYDALVQAD